MTDTKEIKKSILEKLKYIGLDLNNIPEIIKTYEPLEFMPKILNDDNEYKIYKYIPVHEIQIMITPKMRKDELVEKYKYAEPIIRYLLPDKEEGIDKELVFLDMLQKTTKEQIERVEKEQEILNKELPFDIKYENSYLWQIYYSEKKDKYFMLVPSDNLDYSNLFYLLKKQIEYYERKKEYKIFVPICNSIYTNENFKKTEIREIENYIWLLTKEWPFIYDLFDKDGILKTYIIGKAPIYSRLKTNYRIEIKNKEEATKIYKLLKALFILQTEISSKYKFNIKIDTKSNLEFYYNNKKIDYNTLTEFIKDEHVETEKEITENRTRILKMKQEYEEQKEISNKYEHEYMEKQREIFNYLECRKTFFGKFKYYFKGKKKTKPIIENKINNGKVRKVDSEEFVEIEKNKDNYTIEDLVVIYSIAKKELERLKNIDLDIKALKLKNKNLEIKLKNATQYLNEINKHKKSIFDFWKFTNKDEVKSLEEGNIIENKIPKQTLKRIFDYDTDLEELGIKMDKLQREMLTDKELDSIFIATEELEMVNNSQDINLSLENIKQKYEEYNKTEFDVLGDITSNGVEIKPLSNKKHRESKRNKYKILDIKASINKEELEEKIEDVRANLKTAFAKIKIPVSISVYRLLEEGKPTIPGEIDRYNINIEEEVQRDSSKKINLIKINLKENIPVLFYSNIIFFDNLHMTLPIGMDLSTNVLIDCDNLKFDLKSVNEFKLNGYNKENNVRDVTVYEYDINQKGEEENDKESNNNSD